MIFPAALTHQGMTARVTFWTPKIRFHLGADLFVGQIFKEPADPVAGVVDQNVDAPVAQP